MKKTNLCMSLKSCVAALKIPFYTILMGIPFLFGTRVMAQDIETESTHTYVGKQAGQHATDAHNTFVGFKAGEQAKGKDNTFVGHLAGSDSKGGDNNTFIGTLSGGKHSEGDDNVFVGTDAGENHEKGENNVFIGKQAGGNNTEGSGNVFIGQRAGIDEKGSDMLYIHNSESKDPLIFGKFDDRKLMINGKLGIGTEPKEALTVGGNIRMYGEKIMDKNDLNRIHLEEGLLRIHGNVEIGSNPDNNRITLKGVLKAVDIISADIKAKDITASEIIASRVTLDIGSFPDYVFSSTYRLRPLAEVDQYIQANHHLPGIPSEKEVIETGLDLSRINLLLVEKIEELTLYTIEQEKQLDLFEAKLKALEESIRQP